jgi:hypothetical protein
MASIKTEKPAVGPVPPPGAKKEPAKPSGTTPKAPAASKPAPKKTEQKPREPKKKVYIYIYISAHILIMVFGVRCR